MKPISLVFACAIALFVDHLVAQDNRWDYPLPNAPTEIHEVSAGRAGNLRVFVCRTTDSVEKVVLWYAKRLHVGDDQNLVRAASQGFKKAEQDSIQFSTVNDTNERRDYTYFSADFVKSEPHISIWHRPDFNQSATVTISISKISTGTSIHIIKQTARNDPAPTFPEQPKSQ